MSVSTGPRRSGLLCVGSWQRHVLAIPIPQGSPFVLNDFLTLYGHNSQTRGPLTLSCVSSSPVLSRLARLITHER